MESLKSKALSDNLAVTRIAGVEFGEEARWLLSHTETYYGIQSRCKELLEEVFHPYVNPLDSDFEIIPISGERVSVLKMSCLFHYSR